MALSAAAWGRCVAACHVNHVNLDGDSKTCECKGFGRWKHCKHAEGLAALVKAGKL